MNVIVIVADSLRRDHLGCYWNEWIKTPNLDEFASDAMVFDQCYSEGLATGPARTAMWTGRYTLPFRGWRPWDPEDIVVAEWLWDKGFTSAFFTDVPHHHQPGFNYDRGFDTREFIRGQESDPWITDESIDISERMAKCFRATPASQHHKWIRDSIAQYLRNTSMRRSEEDYFVARVCRNAIEWLKAHEGQDRLFLVVDCFDPHGPYDPPPRYKEQYNPGYDGLEIISPLGVEVSDLTEQEMRNMAALYAGEVSLVDRWVGELLTVARELGLFESSLIIFTTDHGEHFGDHGIIGKAGGKTYGELVHLPFIMRTPELCRGGRRNGSIVQACDLAPTIYDFVGVDHPPGLTGRSLMPLLEGKIDKLRDYAYTGWHGACWSIRNDRWSFQLMLREDATGANPAPIAAIRQHCADGLQRELYNLQQDPRELNNVITENWDMARELELNLRQFMAGLKWEVHR